LILNGQFLFFLHFQTDGEDFGHEERNKGEYQSGVGKDE
jgi:hypothetical protein